VGIAGPCFREGPAMQSITYPAREIRTSNDPAVAQLVVTVLDSLPGFSPSQIAALVRWSEDGRGRVTSLTPRRFVLTRVPLPNSLVLGSRRGSVGQEHSRAPGSFREMFIEKTPLRRVPGVHRCSRTAKGAFCR
jgi:hypothetical protein